MDFGDIDLKLLAGDDQQRQIYIMVQDRQGEARSLDAERDDDFEENYYAFDDGSLIFGFFGLCWFACANSQAKVYSTRALVFFLFRVFFRSPQTSWEIHIQRIRITMSPWKDDAVVYHGIDIRSQLAIPCMNSIWSHIRHDLSGKAS